MSSSQIRSIRHTSTVIALEVEAALCQVAFDVEKEVELTGRMKEGEKKRARTKGATATSGKGKGELDNKLRSCKARQAKLEEFTKEFIDRQAPMSLHMNRLFTFFQRFHPSIPRP